MKAPDGKVFAGWSKISHSSDSSLTTDNVDYLVYDDIKLEDLTSETLSLYAVWIDDHLSTDKFHYTVYLDGINGNNNNTGLTASAAVKTIRQAYSLLDPNGTTTTNRIIIIGTLNTTGTDGSGIALWDGSEHKKATISGNDGDSELNIGNNSSDNSGIILAAPTVFENLKITKNCVQVFIYCYGNNLTMGENLNVVMGTLDETDGNRTNGGYAIPDGCPAFTILGGGHYNDRGTGNISELRKPLTTLTSNISQDITIKLISGDYGRVSGFGRSYESYKTTSLETLCPKIIVCGSASVGTLAAGHLDSNATTGVDEQGNFKTAELIVRNSNEIGIFSSPSVIYLVGGNVGNTNNQYGSRSTFIGNVDISIFGGDIINVYGAGLGRVLSETKPNSSDDPKVPQTSMSGLVSINICGGTVHDKFTKIYNNKPSTPYEYAGGDIYGGGAAAALSSTYAKDLYANAGGNW